MQLLSLQIPTLGTSQWEYATTMMIRKLPFIKTNFERKIIVMYCLHLENNTEKW